MRHFGAIRRFNSPTWVTPEALNVAPDLLGMVLATPGRRMMAIGLDALVVVLMSSFPGFWQVLGMVAAGGHLRTSWATHSWQRRAWLFLALAALLALAIQDIRHPASRAVAEIEINSPDTEAISAAPKRTSSEAERIALLEHELEKARKPKDIALTDEIEKLLASLGLGFGRAIAYFTLLPYWWKGQTLGKRALGLRVVELTGKPLTLLNCLSRYGGYAAGMATGLFGFIQVFWDINRQAIQDKIAHTVVVDLRQPRRA